MSLYLLLYVFLSSDMAQWLRTCWRVCLAGHSWHLEDGFSHKGCSVWKGIVYTLEANHIEHSAIAAACDHNSAGMA